MQVGTLNVKLVIRKLQNHNTDFQFMLLAGFTSALTHTTAPYVETLSPNHVLSRDEIDRVIAKLMKHSNSADFKDISNPGVTKKLDKLLDVDTDTDGVTITLPAPTWSTMGIGRYAEAMM